MTFLQKRLPYQAVEVAKPLPESGGHTRGEKRKVVLANDPVQPTEGGGGKESFKKVTTQPSLGGKERIPSKKVTTQTKRGRKEATKRWDKETVQVDPWGGNYS